ncbi:MAG: hypothetical protein RIQ52_1089 [Pseudomonadota bacterium]|jgi:biopolymer transport protein ExbB
MWEILNAGGWIMWPLVICSVVAMSVTLERLWYLRTEQIVPADLVATVWRRYDRKQGMLDAMDLREIRGNSPLGVVLATGLANRSHGRQAMLDSMEQAGRQVIHGLERYLNTLGTIASVAPYLGLLGSILGMIKVFSSFSAAQGSGNPALLAGGLSEILMTTAAGLGVAIPALMAYRYLQGRVTELALQMENEAVTLVALVHGEREEGF